MAGVTASILDFGAVANMNCTAAIQDALDTVGEKGGGTVVIPEGIWLSGTLFLRSGVTLFLSPGSVLKDTGNLADHPEVDSGMKTAIGAGGESHAGDIEKHYFLHAANAENITITGGGTLDGSGPAYWDVANTAASGWIPARRPRVSPMIDFSHCKRIVIRDIRIIDSPGWTVHPYCCDDVLIDNIRVENNLFGPNTDGIDVNGCRDVFITNCILTCGDDCIIIKASQNARSCERILVANCVVTTNCIGIGIGQEVESGVRDMTVTNCVFRHAQRMFSIGLWNGGFVENVTVTGCTGDTLETFPLTRPIHIETKRHAQNDNADLGTIRNVQISNFIARTEGRILVVAEREGLIEGVTLRDVTLQMPFLEDAAALTPALGTEGSSQYANRNLEARKQNAAVIVEHVDRLVLDNVQVAWPEAGALGAGIPYAYLWGRHLRDARIDASSCHGHAGGADAVLEDVQLRKDGNV